MIPLVDLRAQYAPLREEILAAVAGVLDGMQLTLGPNVRAFEQEFAAYCGARFCIGAGSGTDALILALWALGVGSGDEVILPAHTFIATAEAVSIVGATPVVVDVEPLSRCIDPAAVAAAITARTRAIVAVHIHGQMADLDALLPLARQHGAALIEDAAQAHGAELNGRRAGSIGDIACFSFYCSKNLGAYGEAGALTTGRADLAERLLLLRDHGQRERYTHALIGTNSRLDEMQAAILRVKLRRLDEWNEARRGHAARLSELFAGAGIELPTEAPRRRHVYHHYALLTSERDELRHDLTAVGIGTGIHYPTPVHLQPAYANLGLEPGSLPVAERIARSVLSLPMYAELTDTQLQEVAAAVLRSRERQAASSHGERA